ncbi:putative membrane protein [Clavibacter sp. B3I6]|nr:putative membrane protein [Clavibacter sp. B3I6]
MTSSPEGAPSPVAPHGRWRRLRRRWLGGPVALLVLPVVIGYVVVHTLVDLSLGEDALRPERLITRAVLAAVSGVILGVVLRRIRARADAGPDGLDLTEAVEDGRLPPGADVEAWTGALLRRRASAEAEVAPLLSVLGGALVVGGVVWGVLGGPWYAWALALGLAAVIVALHVMTPRRLARIDALLMPLLDAEDAARSV